MDLTSYNRDGLELFINKTTGETFATQGMIARLCNKESTSIRYYYTKKGVEPAFKDVLVQDSRGVGQLSKLYDEKAICEALAEFAPTLLAKCAQAGLRVYLHRLAGYSVSSEAVIEQKPSSQGDILLAMAQSFKDMETRQLALEAQVNHQSSEIIRVANTFKQLGSEINVLKQFTQGVDPEAVKQMTPAQKLNYICQNLGTVLAKFGFDDAFKLPWRQLGVEMKTSQFRYDLNARVANARRRWESEVEEWKQDMGDYHKALEALPDAFADYEREKTLFDEAIKNGQSWEYAPIPPQKPEKPVRPIRPTRPMILKRDGHLQNALKIMPCVVQFYVNAINAGETPKAEKERNGQQTPTLQAVITVDDIMQ